MFNAMAQKVKDAQSSDDDEQENSPTLANSPISAVQQNSILDNLLLAEEHLVFKFSSIDPGVKCSEIVASVNVANYVFNNYSNNDIFAGFVTNANGWFGDRNGNKRCHWLQLGIVLGYPINTHISRCITL
jgi:hypothetical protein